MVQKRDTGEKGMGRKEEYAGEGRKGEREREPRIK